MYIHFMNMKALNIFGYQMGELGDIQLSTLFHKTCKKELENTFESIKTSQTHLTALEFTGVHKNL